MNVRCSSCRTENKAGRKFCRKCGFQLPRPCPACNFANEPDDEFCGECGGKLGPAPAVEPELAAKDDGQAAPRTERRLVSILFADLVDFTALSEGLDPEEVQKLQKRYFDTCRSLIARYGGTVEKYIGDAVMAMWGVPSAHEDDAERAVRAGLELTAAVTALGQRKEAPDLKIRVGVMTGQAAVTIGAEGQAMVAGDLVNTASRIQAAASPGSVYVGDATKQATDAAIVYEDAGLRNVKGKAQPIHLWQALRVIGLIKGALRSVRLEAPFVGRDEELRRVKKLFHASSEQGRAYLVSLVGQAGMGKSRLEWEFHKYLGGLADEVKWHRGRCLSYGEGVAYSALADMVRGRAGITEEEDTSSARRKLRKTLQIWLTDEGERRWVEPRLAHLIGLEEWTARDRQDLFSAWRRFFEAMAEHHPTVMVFDDLHRADTALLDFIWYLMEWSDQRLFLLILSRKGLADRHLGAAERGSVSKRMHSIHLKPLSSSVMKELLVGLVPDLPVQLRSTILERAEGVPLYAMEILRMLLDRGDLAQKGSAYHPDGMIGLLEVPVSLHALIAERLDGLDPSELQLLRNASVLGKTFSIPALSAVAAIHENDLELRLDSLVQKEILGPPSSEGGPYSFLQDLVREVAHDRLSRQDRKALHLAAASYLSTGWGGHEDENVEVVSSHHLQAYRAAPEDVDAYEIKARAGEMLVRAGHRAASLAATEKAQRYFDQAAELADDSLTKAGILERAGEMALRGDRASQAEERFKQAISLFEAADQTHPAARVSARQAEVEWQTERLQDGIERMEKAFQVLRLEHPDEDLAALAVQLGRLYYHKGDKDLATERIEAALMIAESLSSTGALADALVTKGLILNARGRPQEALGVMKHALEVANRSDLPSVALRANRTLAFLSNAHDRFEEALVYSKRALDLARRLGDRRQEWRMLTDTTSSLWSMGRWDEALRRMAKIPNEYIEQTRFCIIVVDSAVAINLARGNLPEAERIFSLAGRCATAADVWERFTHLITHARILLAGKGKEAVALSKAEEALKSRNTLGMNPLGKAAFIQATHAAFALGKIDKVEQLLEMIEALPPGERSPLLEAQLSRFRARLAQVLGKQEGIVPSFEKAAGIFQELGTPFWRAVTLLEHGEWLHTWARRVDAEAILTEAKYLFQRLKARPFLERLERLHHSTVSV